MQNSLQGFDLLALRFDGAPANPIQIKNASTTNEPLHKHDLAFDEGINFDIRKARNHV